ncbi:MAG: hypothetical protein QOE65_1604 [Solirubrobacteraceae bacterium]|jgi:hypothetical protein|nr:hypothetical protein [Solirubrobacteraceae bacterium]
MRHVARLLALACALALPAGAHAVMSGSGTPGPADARLRLVACLTSLDAGGPSLTVDSTMRSLHSGDRMAMRFELWQRGPLAPRFHRVPGSGLGTWNPATDGVQRFRFRKPIQNLPAPAVYFVRVAYRWRDAGGHTVATTARSTRLCRQPDVRPDLRVVSVAAPQRRATGFAYPVVVRNAGRAPSGDFEAVLTMGDTSQPGRTVAGLAPGERRTVELAGPRCAPGTAASVQLDPDNRVDESDERNNVRSFACS